MGSEMCIRDRVQETTRQSYFSKHPIGPLVLGHSSRHARRRPRRLDTSWCQMTTKRKPRPAPPARAPRHRHPDRTPAETTPSCDETAHALPHMVAIIAAVVALELGIPALAGVFVWSLSWLACRENTTATGPDQGRPPGEELSGKVSDVVLFRISVLAAALRFFLLGTSFWALQDDSVLLGSLILGTSVYLDFTGTSRFVAAWPTTGDLAACARVTLLTSACWAFQTGDVLLASMVLGTSVYLDITGSSRHPTPLPGTG